MPSENESKSMSLSSTSLDRHLSKLKKDLDNTSDLKEREKIEKEIHKIRSKLQKDLLEKEKKERLELAKEEGKILNDSQEKLYKTIEKVQTDFLGVVGDATSLITSKLDPIIDGYVKNIQVLSAHLQGTGTTYTKITDNLQNALSGQGLVSQQKVFNNLTEYVRSGITYNVEQRAFLKAVADDIDLVFNDWTTSMNQLVRIQMSDSTSNRLALEYSLQEFLNENYKTSEYIKDSFATVSNSLLTSQSTMTAQNAMAYEATVQTWLGSLYSAGVNQSTISSLAKAIDQLGSGDISGLGSGISNLVLMGASRAGLDYGAILNQGLTSSTTDQLLSGISSYLAEMGANQSNVVRSQLGNIFGVNITDLIAANNLRTTSGGVSTDIGNLLGDFSGFIPATTRLSNLMSNLMYSWGTNIASSPAEYFGYKAANFASSVFGDLLEGVNIGGGILPFEVNVGKVIKAAPMIPIAIGLVQTMADAGSSLISGLKGTLTGAGGLTGIFNALGTAIEGSTVKISDAGVSGSAYFGTGTSSDLLDSSLTNINSLLSGSSVMVEGDEPTLEDNVSIINDNVAIIVELLTDHLISIDDQLNLMSMQSMTYSYAHDQGVSF